MTALNKKKQRRNPMSGLTIFILSMVALVWFLLFVGFTGFTRLTKKGIDPTAVQPHEAVEEAK
jgi:Na+/proline symporter